jgi:flagellin FlaB
VGIGTLVVFIALVLVAAVAAGVLISTAGLLQAQSEATGQEAQRQVINNLQTQSVIGYVQTKDFDQSVVVIEGTGGTERVGAGEAFSVTDVSTTCPSGNKYRLQFSSSGNTQESAKLTVGNSYDITVEAVEQAEGYKLRFSRDGSTIGTFEPTVDIEPSVDDTGCDSVTLEVNGKVEFTGGNPATAGFKSVPSTEVINRISLTVSKTPGAGSVAISEMTISYVGPDSISRLTYEEGKPDGNSFIADAVTGEDIELRQTSDRTRITLDATDISGDGFGIRASESVTLRLTTQAGASRTIKLVAPPNLFGKSAVVLAR